MPMPSAKALGYFRRMEFSECSNGTPRRASLQKRQDLQCEPVSGVLEWSDASRRSDVSSR